MREELPHRIKKLIVPALERGYVTRDALNAVMPPDDYTSEEIEDMLGALSSKGIAIVDTELEGAVFKTGATPSEGVRCCNFC